MYFKYRGLIFQNDQIGLRTHTIGRNGKAGCGPLFSLSSLLLPLSGGSFVTFVVCRTLRARVSFLVEYSKHASVWSAAFSLSVEDLSWCMLITLSHADSADPMDCNPPRCMVISSETELLEAGCCLCSPGDLPNPRGWTCLFVFCIGGETHHKYHIEPRSWEPCKYFSS